MPAIHAYRRKKPHTVEVLGQTFKFEAVAPLEFVCDVPEGVAVVLLGIPEGYRLHEAALPPPPADIVPPAGPDNQAPEPTHEHILHDMATGATLDLRTLDKAALMAFANEQGMTVHPAAKENTIRDKLVAFFKAGA